MFPGKIIAVVALLLILISVQAVLSNPSVDEGEFFSDGGIEEKVVWGKMVGEIPAPPQLVYEIYTDPDSWYRMGIPRLIESRLVHEKVLSQVGKATEVDDFFKALGSQVFSIKPLRKRGGVWHHLHFQYFNIPWPVANRWMILDTKDIETKSQDGIYRSEFSYAAGNLKSIEGYIQFAPYRGDRKKTRLEYYVRVDPASHVPKFLVRWGVRMAMPRTIKAIRREALRRLTGDLKRAAFLEGDQDSLNN
ncbi:MAG: hypothetical protein HYY44_04635 [Deltaproteobacteria bacterium]|nr:hypothetical protein [Deltaproteobacteria bacterium]MBI4374168.1 hypothetical protein [Deltaproteobacteria bacterium]